MFIAIPSAVRESILVKLFQGEAINDEDDNTEVLAGFCETIVHPSHLTRNSECPRNHYRNGLHIIGKLKKQQCGAKLSLLIPMDEQDLRIVIIPRPGVAHTHPSFPYTKIPLLNGCTGNASMLQVPSGVVPFELINHPAPALLSVTGYRATLALLASGRLIEYYKC
ncbi:hypothetical protein B0H16DRAFT_1748080 [Mycena metata]|uniref:Uncharacterized protein n=1 Tax=Mycena metata TaxID=1033252 RepID=A0AAD7E051_9AGAR|nr:hypothetical protein B0H16DRAFT_1748080 [Mycena metata]